MISISHLNREATKIVEDARRANVADIGKMLGRANVSESLLMIDNCDVGYIITKEYGPDGEQYLSFLLIRTRTGYDLDYFCQPFLPGNDIKLEEDFDTFAKYKTSINKKNDSSAPQDRSYVASSDYTRDVKKIDISDMSHEELMEEIKNRPGVNVAEHQAQGYDSNGKYVGNLSGYTAPPVPVAPPMPMTGGSFFDRPQPEPVIQQPYMRDALEFYDMGGNMISEEEYSHILFNLR